MGIKFLGTPVKQFDKLCREEEKVVIEVKCFKTEVFEHREDDRSVVTTTEDVLIGAWSSQIKSWRDIFQIDDEDDYLDKKELTDKLRESLR